MSRNEELKFVLTNNKIFAYGKNNYEIITVDNRHSAFCNGELLITGSMNECINACEQKEFAIICDVCKESCKLNLNNEYATLESHWGFDSGMDGVHSECHICESCFDKIEEFIQSLGGKIRHKNYI